MRVLCLLFLFKTTIPAVATARVEIVKTGEGCGNSGQPYKYVTQRQESYEDCTVFIGSPSEDKSSSNIKQGKSQNYISSKNSAALMLTNT